MTALRIQEELRGRGFMGKYTIVKDLVRRLRPETRRQPVLRFETSKGQQAQMDYATYEINFTAEGRRRVNLFSYVLGYSRRQYLHFTESQDFETTIREHVRAFTHLGGCAATCLYDNMKVVVARYEGDEPIYNTRFLAFATHYGFRPAACRPRRPQTTGKVERPFYFVETNLLSGREFRSVEHLNEVTAWWLAEVADVRVHRQTRRRPIDMHAEEIPHLIPLPERSYEVAEVVYRTVDAEGFIAYGQNRYSVPWHYIGQVLSVRITDEEVTVYDPRLEVLARHRRFPPTERHRESRQGEHLPPRDATQRREALRQRFTDLGPLAVRFLEGLLASQRYGWDQAQKVLALSGTYHRDDLLAALERAVRYGAFSANSVERILAVQARPKTPLERMADEEACPWKELFGGDPTPLRPATDYQHLLFEEPEDHGDTEKEDTAGPEDDDGEACGQPA
jgi:transposase